MKIDTGELDYIIASTMPGKFHVSANIKGGYTLIAEFKRGFMHWVGKIRGKDKAEYLVKAANAMPGLLDRIRELEAERERAVVLPKMQKLNEKQLFKMNEERVIVRFPDLDVVALVSYNPPDSEYYNEEDGDCVYITNSLGGRSTYKDVLSQGGYVMGNPRAEAKAAMAGEDETK